MCSKYLFDIQLNNITIFRIKRTIKSKKYLEFCQEEMKHRSNLDLGNGNI